MLPRPATPATKATTAWSLRLPRDAALLLLRNNLFALAGITLFNYFFPFYPHLKRALLPRIWLQPYNKIEFWVITLAFGLNILVALISIRYPRAPFPPIRTPVKPATTGTPVRRRVTGLGTSPVRALLFSGYHALSGTRATVVIPPLSVRAFPLQLWLRINTIHHPVSHCQLQHVVLHRDAAEPLERLRRIIQFVATCGVHWKTCERLAHRSADRRAIIGDTDCRGRHAILNVYHILVAWSSCQEVSHEYLWTSPSHRWKSQFWVCGWCAALLECLYYWRYQTQIYLTVGQTLQSMFALRAASESHVCATHWPSASFGYNVCNETQLFFDPSMMRLVHY